MAIPHERMQILASSTSLFWSNESYRYLPNSRKVSLLTPPWVEAGMPRLSSRQIQGFVFSESTGMNWRSRPQADGLPGSPIASKSSEVDSIDSQSWSMNVPNKEQLPC